MPLLIGFLFLGHFGCKPTTAKVPAEIGAISYIYRFHRYYDFLQYAYTRLVGVGRRLWAQIHHLSSEISKRALAHGAAPGVSLRDPPAVFFLIENSVRGVSGHIFEKSEKPGKWIRKKRLAKETLEQRPAQTMRHRPETWWSGWSWPASSPKPK